MPEGRYSCEESWYKHTLEKVIETDEVKFLSDFPIQTDNKLDYNGADIVAVNKARRSCLLIDITCPFDTRFVKKEEKTDVYKDLRRELKRLLNLREIKIIPVIIGTLGTIGMNHRKWLQQIDINCSTHALQKVTLLGTARIIRKVLIT